MSTSLGNLTVGRTPSGVATPPSDGADEIEVFSLLLFDLNSFEGEVIFCLSNMEGFLLAHGMKHRTSFYQQFCDDLSLSLSLCHCSHPWLSAVPWRACAECDLLSTRDWRWSEDLLRRGNCVCKPYGERASSRKSPCARGRRRLVNYHLH